MLVVASPTVDSESDVLSRALSLAVHEIRTPITVVAGYLRMLLREQAGPLQDAQRRMLEEADRSCARIAALVSEMSELGRLEGSQLVVPGVTFDLAAVVKELANNMHERTERGIRLDVRASEHLDVSGDRTRIATAIRALVHAAVREQADSGVVVVELSSHSDVQNGWAVGAIGDPAIVGALVPGPDAESPLDEWRGGTGLALPISRRVIEAHGGSVWSAPGSNPRIGSGFRLPLAR
jgi:signal transduction histidine kinase